MPWWVLSSFLASLSLWLVNEKVRNCWRGVNELYSLCLLHYTNGQMHVCLIASSIKIINKCNICRCTIRAYVDVPYVHTCICNIRAFVDVTFVYFSRYIEIAKFSSTSLNAVITHLKSIFARQGIPQYVMSAIFSSCFLNILKWWWIYSYNK